MTTPRITKAHLKNDLARMKSERDVLREQQVRLERQLAVSATAVREAKSKAALKRSQLLADGLVDLDDLFDVEFHEQHGDTWATITVKDKGITDAIKKRLQQQRNRVAFQSTFTFDLAGSGLVNGTDLFSMVRL